MPRKITVSNLIKIMHDFAPPALAYDWDNVGFLLGDAASEIKNILLCLDITPQCVDEAIRLHANLIISHHPLIFRPLKKITNPLYLKLIKNEIAVISAHTNLDITPQGVNHQLAELFCLNDLEILSSSIGSDLFQVAVYSPLAALDDLTKALQISGARNFNYSPSTGEIKLEFFCDSFDLNKIIASIHKHHPAPDPVYAVYPQKQMNKLYGLGVIGSLPDPITISDFAGIAKETLQTPAIKVWLANKKPETVIQKIALCGGSGSSLIASASNRADLMLSGEFGYHSMLDSPLPLIEAGHFHTEFPVLDYIKKLLEAADIKSTILPRNLHETSTHILYL
ncbi:MAG: Nif3-like dinuclear metal center hexameric protein [Candidatus Cloacimonetes bacterium]|nr:Nif3-like dinuclear metal center hexameric protein [Candidatus Cloacimonadota bacterium]